MQAASQVAPQPPRHSGAIDIDYQQCQSTSDYGWPRFEKKSSLAASPWAGYLAEVYGGLPTEYPFCTFDLWYINASAAAYPSLGLTPNVSKTSRRFTVLGFAQLLSAASDVSGGEKEGHRWRLFTYRDGDYFLTDFGMWNYHSGLAAAPSNTWIEIQHTRFRGERDAMWFTRARGSGIWYNTGRTISFLSDPAARAHEHAYRYFEERGCKIPMPMQPPSGVNCSDPRQMTSQARAEPCLEAFAGPENALGRCAAALGYESVQFVPAPGSVVETFGHVGWLELLATSLKGNYSCGTPEGGTSAGLRFGWKASEACDCVESSRPLFPSATNCDGNKRRRRTHRRPRMHNLSGTS